TTPPPRIEIPPANYATGDMLHLIALDKPLAGSMHGIQGADYECHRQARKHRLMGTYRAFLSSETQNLNSIIYYTKDKQIPIVNSKNQILFKSWNSLTDGSGAYFNSQTPIYSFDGNDVMYDPK
ncbi:collagen alpha-1(XVIII) chain, partial [Biomphalaria glabrata]